MELSKELYYLITDYIYYCSTDSKKMLDVEIKIKKNIKENLDSLSKILSFDAEISSINSQKVRDRLIDFIKSNNYIFSGLSESEKIKIYFETDNYKFLTQQLYSININEFYKYFGDNQLTEKNVKRLFDVFDKELFKYINKLNIPNNSIELLLPVNLPIDKDLLSFVVNNSSKFSSKSLLMIMNNEDFKINPNENQILSILNRVDDSSIKKHISLVGNSEVDMTILSKVVFEEFDNIAKSNPNIIEKYLSKENLNNGIKINILKLFLLNKNILNINSEKFLNLLDSIEEGTLDLARLKNITPEYLEIILSSKYLNKLSIYGVNNLINFNVVSNEKKIEIIEYIVSNDLLDIKYLEMMPPFKRLISSSSISVDLFEKLILSNKFLPSEIAINSQYSEEDCFKLLNNPMYYERLSSQNILKLLNLISKDRVLNLLSDKLFLTNIRSDDFYLIKTLEFEDLINNDIIFEYLLTNNLMGNLINFNLNYSGIELLKNKNVCKFIFGNSDFVVDGDLENVSYLIEYSYNINNQKIEYNLEIVRTFFAIYKSLGIKGATDLINLSEVNYKVKDLLKIKDNILQSRINYYRNDHTKTLNHLYDSIIYQLNSISDPLNIYDYSDPAFDWFVKIVKSYNLDEEMENIFREYVVAKGNPQEVQKLNLLNSKIRMFSNGVRDKIISDLTLKYNYELIENLRHYLKIDPQYFEKLKTREIKKEEMKLLVEEVLDFSDSTLENKFNDLLSDLKPKINFGEFLTFEEFQNKMLIPILSNKFKKAEFIQGMGYKEPENYKTYIFNKKMNEEVKRANFIFNNYINKEDIFLYISSKSNEIKDSPSSIVLLKRIRNVLSRYSEFIEYDGEKLICKPQISYDEAECLEYNRLENNINKSSKIIFNSMKNLLEREIQQTNIYVRISKDELPINDKAFDVKKDPLSVDELKRIYKNFDFSENLTDISKERLKKFILYNIYNLRISSAVDDERFYISSFGYFISHFQEAESICRMFGINLNEISMEELRTIQDYLALELTPIEEECSKKVISDIMIQTKFMHYMNSDTRLKLNFRILEDAYKKVSKTVPTLKTKEYEILDCKDPRQLNSRINDENCFSITAPGNDFLIYCMLNKNGSIILLKDPETQEIIGRVSAVRRGNVYFMHQIRLSDEYQHTENNILYCENLIKKIGKELIEATAKTDEPIEFVTIKDFNINYENSGFEILDESDCEYLGDPIKTDTEDYKEYKAKDYLDNDLKYKSFYHNYNDGNTYMICRAQNKTKADIKDYDAKPIYLRKRNAIEFFDFQSTKLDLEEALRKFQKIMYLKFRETNDEFESTRMAKLENVENIKNIYVGEDFCIIIYNNEEIRTINLGYDERSIAEIDNILQNLEINRRNL